MRWLVGALVAIVAPWSAGCGSAEPPVPGPGACAPVCQGAGPRKACGDDGCGGSCGTCGAGETCSADGACSDSPSGECDLDCAALGLECGDHCGRPCGTCNGAQMACVEGQCACQPACTASTCGLPDGCGAACGPCASSTSCPGCVLELSVVESEVIAGQVASVVLALDFAPAEGAPLPSMADLRIQVGGGAKLMQVATGEALLDAQKDLLADPTTGKPFRELPDGVIQILVYSGSNTDAFGPGRLAFFKFLLDGPTQPGTFKLVVREQTFAPPPADQILWGGGYDGLVAVWPGSTP